MTYVLVHGGQSTARFWDRLVPLLDGDVLAIDLPGRAGRPADLATLTVDDEVASVAADVRAGAASAEGPVVLVAHSSGGLVVPGVVAALAATATPVVHVVLNAASVPPEGGLGLDCMKPSHAARIRQAKDAGIPMVTPGPPADPEAMREAYGGDPLDDETLAFVSDPARVVVDTMNHYFQAVRWSQAGGVAVTYVVNERDRPVPTELQETMLARLPVTPAVVRLDTGHVPAVTHPEALAAVVRDVYRI